MSIYDYLVVGSGLFGSVFAYEACKRGKRVLVLERRGHIGGNLYCENLEGIQIHKYGAHIFHTSNQNIWNYVNQFSAFNNYINTPIANFKGEIYNLPFNMNTFSKMWGISAPKQAQEMILRQSAEIKGMPTNLEEQAISLVGRDIYEKLVKGYTEKQWGRDCKDLPPFIIQRLPVRFTYDNNYFKDRYQGIPEEGYNAIFENLLDGCDIKLNADYLEDREGYRTLADKVVFTGTIDSYFGYRFGRLEYRSLKFETERLEIPNYQGAAVMNFTDRETPYTRIIEHKHFMFGTQPVTYLTKEYPCEWRDGMEPYYPVNDEKNQNKLEQYLALSRQEDGVIFGGRLAEYRYYDMDKTILSALRAVEQEFVKLDGMKE